MWCSISVPCTPTLQDAGGPSIPMRFGRTDASGPESVQPEGNLPGMPPKHALATPPRLLLHSIVDGAAQTRCSLLSQATRGCPGQERETSVAYACLPCMRG
jgi:hypothetical protein